MTGAGFYVTGEGGLSSVAAMYGSLFQQKVQREQSKKKTCILCSTFLVSEPTTGYKQYCCTLLKSSLRQWNVELCMLYKSPLRRTLEVTHKQKTFFG